MAEVETRVMTLADLRMVLDWAAEEGWNPGLDDAEAFLAADPGGVFLRLVDGQPAAAISVVNHSPELAFLGLYLCRPAFRGQGHGLAVWTHAMAHAGDRCVLLDGVPAQQDNYVRSGFSRLGRTIRYRGEGPFEAGADIPRPIEAGDLPAIFAADRAASGYGRTAFLHPWLAGTASRRTLVLGPPGAPHAWATGRACGEGIKIGPLSAPDEGDALSLIAALTPPGPVFIDVPEACTGFVQSLAARDFQPVFETARMTRGTPPAERPAPFTAVATLELG